MGVSWQDEEADNLDGGSRSSLFTARSLGWSNSTSGQKAEWIRSLCPHKKAHWSSRIVYLLVIFSRVKK